MDLQKATQFWSWFQENNAKYLFLEEMNKNHKDEAMKVLQEELHNYCDSIYYLIGNDTEDNKKELIITAEGNVDYFSQVEFLIDHSPQLNRWSFLKFKPAIGAGYKAVIQDREFDPKITRCMLIEDTEHPETIGLRMFYNDFEMKSKRRFAFGTYVMLDMILGEKSATLDIERLEIVKTPSNIDKMNFFYLDEIKKHLENKKAGL